MVALVPSWSTYRAGYEAGDAEDSARDPVLTGYVDQLGGALKALHSEVSAVEARQVTLDRRLAEFGGLLQGLQEDQLSQGGALERGQQVTAVGVHRALHTAVTVQRRMEQDGELQDCIEGFSDGWAKRLEQCYQQHSQWLVELSAEVAALTSRSSQVPLGRDCTDIVLPSGTSVSALDSRIAALEQGQKTVAVGARRALHTAMVVHQQQQSQEHDNQWEKCLDNLPITDLEQQCVQRFAEQDERLDKVLHMLDSLTDRVLLSNTLVDTRSERSYDKGSRGLRSKVEELEACVYNLTSEFRLAGHHQRPWSPDDGAQVGLVDALGQVRDFVSGAVESLEARVERSLNEVSQRLDSLQDGRDQQRLSLRQLGQQLPEVSQKLDQLWTQCQYYFPRVKEHDVHFSFFRSSLEAQNKSAFEEADDSDRRAGLASRGTSASPARSCTAALAAAATSAAPPHATEEGESGARARMLAQVMERLHAGRGAAPRAAPGAEG